jgi:hypothetical protein
VSDDAHQCADHAPLDALITGRVASDPAAAVLIPAPAACAPAPPAAHPTTTADHISTASPPPHHRLPLRI